MQPLLPFYLDRTARQREVLELASTGLTNREIARRLHIAPSVVAEHLTNIYTALDPLTAQRANRYLLIRHFTLFFYHHPHLCQFSELHPTY